LNKNKKDKDDGEIAEENERRRMEIIAREEDRYDEEDEGGDYTEEYGRFDNDD
jgi:hypothetical protein